MNRFLRASLPALALCAAALVRAGIELVALPPRDEVELTIYREMDLTLVRERRTLVLAPGVNRLQFSWAGTRLDPTSLELEAAAGPALTILDRSLPPRVAQTVVWSVQADRPGPRPVMISYFLSGIAWSASYQAVASADGRTMDLDGDVRIDNRSGEEFEAARVRLVVGHARLVETILDLAGLNDRRQAETGQEQGEGVRLRAIKGREVLKEATAPDSNEFDSRSLDDSYERLTDHAKVVLKEGLADQFLYSIPGTEAIRDGWSLRLPNLRAKAIPFAMLYRYDPERYGTEVHALMKLTNSQESGLGAEPLPDGDVQVFRRGETGRLVYQGRAPTKYIPIGEAVELDLGQDPELKLELTTLAVETGAHAFDRRGNVTGWDETRRERLTLRSGKPFPVAAEVLRHLPARSWTFEAATAWEKLDVDSVRLRLDLPALARNELDLVATWGQGTRAEVRR